MDDGGTWDEAIARQRQEEADFEALQVKFGFRDAVSPPVDLYDAPW